MNQDQLYQKLLKYSPKDDFSVIYSGKTSKTIEGLYQPDTKEIVIHNKNFRSEEKAMYTGLHELAHHIDFTGNGPRKKPHTGEFPEILADLVHKAIEGGDFVPLKHDAVDRMKRANRAYTEAMKQLGKAMIDVLGLCSSRDYPFEDIVSRELGMSNTEAKTIMAVHTMDISPQVGGELAKKLTKIKDPELRHQAEKEQIIKKPKPPARTDLDEHSRLAKEKKKLERSIETLHKKLEEINLQLEEHERGDPPPIEEVRPAKKADGRRAPA